MADSPLARIPDPVLQQYKKRFDAIDLNKDGIITIREMATVGKVLGYKLSTDELFVSARANRIRDKMSAILQTTHSKAFSCMKLVEFLLTLN